MLIEKIMKKILQPVSEKYFEVYRKADLLEPEQLYQQMLNEMRVIDSSDTDLHGTTIFVTPGCSHNVRNGNHCGCSFCDWNDTYLVHPAKAAILRKKSPELYKDIQFRSFQKLRETPAVPKLMEEISVDNCFDSHQLLYEEINYLMNEHPIFLKKPVIGLLQVRAESVNQKNIVQWKQFFQRTMTLAIGVETGDEWLRNHWLNKGIADKQIKKAIEVVHEQKCFICANLLLMLPGLTCNQNIHHFVNSVIYMFKLGCDSIMVSPLIVKKYTLQNYMKKTENQIFEVLEILFHIKDIQQEFHSKIMFSILNFQDFFKELDLSDETQKFINIITPLLSIGGMKNLDIMFREIEEFRNTNDEYKKFLLHMNEESEWNQIDTTLLECIEITCNQLFSEDKQLIAIEIFKNELLEWSKHCAIF